MFTHKEQKPKIKKMERKKINISSLIVVFISLIITVFLFIGLTILQSRFAKDIVYKDVLIAKANIKENTIIDNENIDYYFTIKAVNVLDLPKDYLVSAQTLVGTKAKVEMSEGEIIAQKDFINISRYTENLTNPVELSIAIGDLTSTDGGRIRGGDVINITLMYTEAQLNGGQSENKGYNGTSIGISNTKSDSESDYNYSRYARYVYENLYVTQVLDASGVKIKSEDTESIASIIIIRIEKEDEEALNNALANCSGLRVSKVINPDLTTKDTGDNINDTKN